MITHHTFLHNKVSIFPQHNNIKIKIHRKSCSQQTKLVLNADFQWGKALVQVAPFHLRFTHHCWGSSSRSARCPSSWGRFVLVLWVSVCLAVDSGSSELISQRSHPESKARELSSGKSNSGKKKPWQFLTWSVYCTTTQLVTPTRVSRGPEQELKSMWMRRQLLMMIWLL